MSSVTSNKDESSSEGATGISIATAKYALLESPVVSGALKTPTATATSPTPAKFVLTQ